MEDELIELVREGDSIAVRRFLDKKEEEYSEDIRIGIAMHVIQDYDMFLVIMDDILVDNDVLHEIITSSYLNIANIINFLLQYGVSPIDIVNVYMDRDFGTDYMLYREECDHEETENSECLECKKETLEYQMVMYILNKNIVTIDELKENSNNEFLDIILDTIIEDV